MYATMSRVVTALIGRSPEPVRASNLQPTDQSVKVMTKHASYVWIIGVDLFYVDGVEITIRESFIYQPSQTLSYKIINIFINHRRPVAPGVRLIIG